MKNRSKAFDHWQIARQVCAMEETIASCLLADPMRTVQLCRAADLIPGDFTFEPFTHIAFAAFGAVNYRLDTGRIPDRSMSRIVLKAAGQLQGPHQKLVGQIDINGFTDLGVMLLLMGHVNRSRVAGTIGRLARIAAHNRTANSLATAAHRANLKAWRLAQDQHDDDVRFLAPVAGPSVGLAGRARSSRPAGVARPARHHPAGTAQSVDPARSRSRQTRSVATRMRDEGGKGVYS